MEFTGEYWKCSKCGHIWDYNDACPNCGNSDDLENLNAAEVKEEADRLLTMLKAHGDYIPFEENTTLPINSVSISEAAVCGCEKLLQCAWYKKGKCFRPDQCGFKQTEC